MWKKLSIFTPKINVPESVQDNIDVPIKSGSSDVSNSSDYDISKSRTKESKYSIHLQKDAKVVEMKLLKLRVSSINMTDEQLDADISMNFTWKIDKNKKDTWKPQFYIDNMVREYRERSETTVTRLGKEEEYAVSQDVHVAGTFSVPMNWKYYPFDSHRLRFTLLSRLNPDDVYLIMDLMDHNLLFNVVENDALNNEEFVFSEMARCGKVYDIESKVLGMYFEVLAMRKRTAFGVFYFPFEFFISMIPMFILLDNFPPQQRITTIVLSICLSVFLKNLIFVPSPNFVLSTIDLYHNGSIVGHCIVLFYITISNITGDLRFIDFINRMKKLNDQRAAIMYLITLIGANIAFILWVRRRPNKIPDSSFLNRDEDSEVHRESIIF